MRTEIISKNYHLDEDLKNIINKKLSRFDKYFDNEAKAKVKLTTVGNNYMMEISVEASGCSVRSAYTGEKMNENIDKILPKLERQIIKYRDKFGTRIKKGAIDEAVVKDLPVEEINKNVVKVKKFEVSKTTVENAVEEMELLNHNFYIFLNGETNKVSVLYRRNDGDYGLIEPEY